MELLARVRLQGLLPHGSLLWDSLLASLYLFPHPENGIYNGDCEKKKKRKHDIFMGGVERVVKCSRVAFVGREQKLIQMNTRKKRSVEGSLRVQP